MPRVRVADDLCTGHGRCYVLAPEIFDADETGHCVVRTSEVSEALRETARLGESSCPEGAISVED